MCLCAGNCGNRIPYFIIRLFVRLIEINNETFVAGLI